MIRECDSATDTGTTFDTSGAEDTDKDGDKNFKVLPWQTKAMHVDYQGDEEDNGGGKRQKTE